MNTIRKKIAKLRSSDNDLKEESKMNGRLEAYPPKGSTDTPKSSVAVSDDVTPFHFVPLKMGGRGGTHVPTRESVALIDEIGGLPALRKMTEGFYKKVFKDFTLDNFIHSRDDPHGTRFATWIHQKLGGEGNLWDADRRERPKQPVQVTGGQVVVHDRSSAHVAAWHSVKRPAKDAGKHFKLDDCRVWMRLHFWAMRESGLLQKSPSFVDFYVRFLGHFVSVYEGSAPTFARDSFRWSASQENIDRYLSNGRKMTDVIGVGLREALRQIPEDEANDTKWPYIKRPQ